MGSLTAAELANTAHVFGVRVYVRARSGNVNIDVAGHPLRRQEYADFVKENRPAGIRYTIREHGHAAFWLLVTLRKVSRPIRRFVRRGAIV